MTNTEQHAQRLADLIDPERAAQVIAAVRAFVADYRPAGGGLAARDEMALGVGAWFADELENRLAERAARGVLVAA